MTKIAEDADDDIDDANNDDDDDDDGLSIRKSGEKLQTSIWKI